MSSLKEAKSAGDKGTTVVEPRTGSDIPVFLGKKDCWAQRVCSDPEHRRRELGGSGVVQIEDPEQSL